MDLCPAERFRQLFQRLDGEGAWVQSLPPRGLSVVRKIAESKDAWLAFLAGSHVPTPPTIVPIKEALQQIKGANGALEGASTERTLKETGLENGKSAIPDGRLNHNSNVETAGKHSQAKPNSMQASEQSGPMLSASRSPRLSLQNASHGERADLNASDICHLSAFVRRRLAIVSVEEQLFHNAHGALPEDDEMYEVDVGMLPGDDGGYASFEELEKEEGESLRKLTKVYTLLGSDEDEELVAREEEYGHEPSKDRKITTLKRPRSLSFGLSDLMETFVRDLRELCEPRRDASQEESEKRKDMPKTVHRKAVSAASVVEELKEFEQRVRIGKIDRVEDCISSVTACIKNQGDTFKEVLAKIDERADRLREEYQKKRERVSAMTRVSELTTGVLGVDTRSFQSTFCYDDGDVEMNKSAAVTFPQSESRRQSTRARKMHIPFAGEDLRCWPRTVPVLNVSPQKLRVPSFYGGRDEDYRQQEDDLDSPKDNIVAMLGVDNPVMKNAIAWRRVYRLREQAIADLNALRERAPRHGVEGPRPNASQKPTQNGTTVKAEEVLVTQSKHTSGRSAGSGSISTERRQFAHQAQREYEIRNEAYQEDGKSHRNSQVKESKERALAKAVVSLICVHEGYTHSSSLALEILSDVLEDFIYLIGVNLSGCRVNIDRQEPHNAPLPRLPSEDDNYERMRLICSSGFQGNYPALQQYIRADIPRLEQSLQESEAKLRIQISRIERELAKFEKPHDNTNSTDINHEERQPDGKNQVNIKDKEKGKNDKTPQTRGALPENAFIFGHVGDNVTLDVLGTLKVPRELATPASEASYYASKAARRNKGYRSRR